MKAFFERWAARLTAWMKDRNGVDQLSLGLLLISLLFQMLASATGVWLFLIISAGSYAWTLFRVFSKRSYKRFEENRKFVAFWRHINGTFLASLFAGILISVFSLARLMKYLLEFHPIPLWSFFFGLILASAVYILKGLDKWNIQNR